MDTKMTTSQQHISVAKKANTSWAALGRTLPASWGVILLLCPVLMRCFWSTGSQSGLSSKREAWMYWRESSRGAQSMDA